jgi:hypothetical protein
MCGNADPLAAAHGTFLQRRHQPGLVSLSFPAKQTWDWKADWAKVAPGIECIRLLAQARRKHQGNASSQQAKFPLKADCQSNLLWSQNNLRINQTVNRAGF